MTNLWLTEVFVNSAVQVKFSCAYTVPTSQNQDSIISIHKNNWKTSCIMCISVSVAQFLVSFTQMMPKKTIKTCQFVILSTLSAYSYIMFSTQFNIKHTHILAGSHLSKQTFKSLQKYKILSICISFFYLHFEMAEIIPNRHESPMSRSGATLNFREPFKPPALSSLPMMAACH